MKIDDENPVQVPVEVPVEVPVKKPVETIQVETPKIPETDLNLQTIQFLHDSGLLFKINQQLLHPHGFGLEADIDAQGVCKGWKPITNRRKDVGGVVFERAEFKKQRARFLKYMQVDGSDRLKARNDALGFVVQDENSK